MSADAPDELVEAVAQVLLPWLLPPTRASIDYPLSAARAVLSVPALAEVIARDAKVREIVANADGFDERDEIIGAAVRKLHIEALYPEAGK